MKTRWRHSLGLGAAALALASLTSGAFAGFVPGGVKTDTYSAQTVALGTGGNTVVVPNNQLTYVTTSGLYSGDTLTFTTTGNGTTFGGTAVVNIACASGVAALFPTGFGCAGTVVTPVTTGTNTITLTFTNPGAPAGTPVTCVGAVNCEAVPPGSTITVTSCTTGGPGNLPAVGTCPVAPAAIPLSTLTVTGVGNLASAAPATTGTGPASVFGTQQAPVAAAPPLGAVPTAFQTVFGQGTLGDVITVKANEVATCPAVICPILTSDANPLTDIFINSANSFAIASAGAGLLIDLSGTGGVQPGTNFLKTTSPATGLAPTTSTAGLAGTINFTNSAGQLDARNGVICCNATSTGVDVTGAPTLQTNTPLASVANVVVTGDFQTLTAAYLRTGNNVNSGVAGASTNATGGTLANGTSGAAGPEQAPSAISTCTTATAATDILSTTGVPGSTKVDFQTLTFAIPSSANVVNGAFINQLTYALCYVTNGSNIIPDTVGAGNSPSGGTTGAGFGSVKWSAQVNVPPLAPIGLVQNAFAGFDMGYAGVKAVFPTVFPATSGLTTFFRLVNTGVGQAPVFAVLIKDAQAGLLNTRTPLQGALAPIVTLGPFGAVYLQAETVAASVGGGLPGSALGLSSTVILLSPQPGLLMSRYGLEPSGDITVTPAGI